jgi:hypothetical protein
MILTLSQQGPRLDSEQEPPPLAHPKITMVHGFYAAMGGFAIQSHYLDKQYPITGQGRLTLTKDGILWLLQMAPEVFPNLTEDEILDKSKASTLVKALTCLRLQCIVRLTMDTSISLLELNVFGHCICTFIIYAIWWHKPMDISEPTLLRVGDGPELQGLVAVLCSYTSMTVPRLPYPLTKCVLEGHNYRRVAGCLNSRTTDDNVSLNSEYSRRTRCSDLSHTGLDRHYSRHYRLIENWKPRYSACLITRFDTTGSPVPVRKCRHPDERGPGVADDKEQIDEYAGLRIERLVQLLNLDASNRQM